MATLKELRDARLQKLKQLRALGIDPYPAGSRRDHECAAVTGDYAKYEGKAVTVAGRVLSLRPHGKLVFIDIKDASGKIQLYVKSDQLALADPAAGQLGFEHLDLLDIGDFVEARGTVTKTKSGEVSVEAADLRLLAKSLRPMGSQWDGLTNKETRLRRRYLDTNMNADVYQRFLRRARFWEVQREFFKAHGFMEMNIPVLEHVTGGADAKPFVTHMDALNQDFYLRISQELNLKRLIGGGYEKVYEIGPRFRNESYSDEHLPEHMAMEFYWAYADWRAGMDLVRRLLMATVEGVYGRTKFDIRGHAVDFAKEWEEIDFADLMRQHYGVDVYAVELNEVKRLLKERRIEIEKSDNLARGVDKLWKELRKTIAGPAFVVNIPKFLSPLAKSVPNRPEVTERFWPVFGGTEMGNAWSELNDPQDQLQRFLEQQRLREAGDAEAQMLDIDYVEMLEYGMPPTFGYGHSERLFWMLEDVSAREGVIFPQLRTEIDPSTKAIYPEVFKTAPKKGERT